MAFTALLKQAMKLDTRQRAAFAERLLESLDIDNRDINTMTEEAFTAELERRHQEFLRDPSVAVTWEAARRRARLELDNETSLAPARR